MRVRLTPLAPLGLLVFAGIAMPQESGPGGSNRYVVASTIQVPADKVDAYVAHYKTGDGAKLMRALMKDNPKFVAFTLQSGLFTGTPSANVTLYTISAYDGAPSLPDPSKRDAIYRAAIGKTYSEYMAGVRAMRTSFGQSVIHVHNMAEGSNSAEGDYVAYTRLKAAEGKQTDLYDQMREFGLPLANHRVKDGQIKAWSFSHYSFPSGSSRPYDATIATTYKDMTGALAGAGGGGTAGAARFAKVFPDKSYVAYVDAQRENAKVVLRELRLIRVVIRP